MKIEQMESWHKAQLFLALLTLKISQLSLDVENPLPLSTSSLSEPSSFTFRMKHQISISRLIWKNSLVEVCISRLRICTEKIASRVRALAVTKLSKLKWLWQVLTILLQSKHSSSGQNGCRIWYLN